MPNDLVSEVILAEHFIQYHLGVMSDMPIEMDVKTSSIGQQLVEENGCLIEPFQVRIEAASPGIRVCLLFQDGRLFCESGRGVVLVLLMRMNLRSEREIRSGIKWRIDIYELHFSRQLRQQRRQHIFLVATDKPVAPLRLPTSGEEIKCSLTIGRALVYVSMVWKGSATRTGACRLPSTYLPSQMSSAIPDLPL